MGGSTTPRTPLGAGVAVYCPVIDGCGRRARRKRSQCRAYGRKDRGAL